MILRFLLALALLAFAPVAGAQDFPKLTGRVVDAANLLDPAQEQALTAKLEALEKQSGRQLVVATVPDLQGYDISDYGYQLGRSWGIGQKGKNDGALLIVAKNDRKIRIESGYGLEGVLTDALSSRIIRNAITPRFKTGDFAGGIDAGVGEIATLLTLPPAEAEARARAAAKAEQDKGDDVNPLMVIFWFVVIGFFILSMARGNRGGRRYGRGGAPVILWGPSLGGSSWGDSGGGSSWGGFGGGGGFSGGGGSFGGGGASGDW